MVEIERGMCGVAPNVVPEPILWWPLLERQDVLYSLLEDKVTSDIIKFPTHSFPETRNAASARKVSEKNQFTLKTVFIGT